MYIEFTKAEALGNDYILLDLFKNDYHSLIPRMNKISQLLSDRHFGIGGDGVILIIPKDEYDCEMRIFNADGSEAEMCGNGIRQVARYFYENISKKDKISVYTKAGVKVVEIIKNKDLFFKVDMGEPDLRSNSVVDNSLIPEKTIINKEFDFGFNKFKITTISMGNPHCVIFVDDLGNLDISSIGPRIENHKLFPNRVNVEFVKVISEGEIAMRVWERGSGETMACGTGACASVVATIVNEISRKRKIKVHLLGGDLDIEWGKDNHIYMTGGANLVFNGTFIKEEF
ncbi:MAG: diaminopimelate epimerase [Brevinematia bacterium]